MSIFHHDEAAGRFSHPRHPGVCLIDTMGIGVTIGMIATYRPSFAVMVLPLTVILQYTVSAVHHCLPYKNIRARIDHCTIFLLIGATYVPYWATKLPPDEAFLRLTVLALLVASGCVFKIVKVEWHAICCTMYVVLGAAGPLIYFNEFAQLPTPGIIGFWVGNACYAVQFVVYATRWPNGGRHYADIICYHEVQHMLLLIGTTTHVHVAGTYL